MDDPAFRARPDLGEQGLEKIAPGAPGWPGRTGCQAPLTGETRLAQRPLRCLGGASLTVRIQHGERSDDRMGWGDRRLAALLGPTATNPDPARDSTTASWGVATWECRESPKGDSAIFIGRPTPHLLILLS